MTAPLPYEKVAYPAAPWQMVGSLWLSLFRLKQDVDELRPAGVYGAAFVSYEEGSPLTYSELLVARPIKSDEHGRRVTITDIWVDSPASVAGGRELWAIPKGLCDFTLESSYRGPVTTTEWSATHRPPAGRERPVHRRLPDGPATAVQGRHLAARAPRGRRREDRHPAGVVEGRAVPRAPGSSTPDGPLGWLRGARQLASFRQAAFTDVVRVSSGRR